jgi:Cof subfamily protein (haloacid dehalogenase superfamily)
MFKIVASDLDGTLLNAKHTIAPFTRNVLNELHEQGKHFVFATGRHHIDVAHIRDVVGIPACMITSNGARIHDENNALIFSKDLAPELVRELVNVAKDDESISIHIYTQDKWFLNRVDKDLTQYHKDSGFSFTFFDPENPPVENVLKVFFIRYDHEYLTQYETRLNTQFGDKVHVAFSTPFCLEVMAAGVSKGAALEAVAALKGFSLQDCIAFGDGMNDVEMLQAAKKGLVMQTAPLRVKEALPNNEVIGSHVDEAVAHYLADHLLK